MGLNVDYSSGDITIKEEKFKDTFEALKELTLGKLSSHYEYIIGDLKQEKTLEGILGLTCFDSEYDDEGNLSIVEYCGEKLDEEEMQSIMETIAPFVEEGSEFIITACDVDYTYSFDDSQVTITES